MFFFNGLYHGRSPSNHHLNHLGGYFFVFPSIKQANPSNTRSFTAREFLLNTSFKATSFFLSKVLNTAKEVILEVKDSFGGIILFRKDTLTTRKGFCMEWQAFDDDLQIFLNKQTPRGV